MPGRSIAAALAAGPEFAIGKAAREVNVGPGADDDALIAAGLCAAAASAHALEVLQGAPLEEVVPAADIKVDHDHRDRAPFECVVTDPRAVPSLLTLCMGCTLCTASVSHVAWDVDSSALRPGWCPAWRYTRRP